MSVRSKPYNFQAEHCEWATPQSFFDALNREFGFTLDACASAENAKCERFYSLSDESLTKPWEGTVWCNPPYGRSMYLWVRKAFESAMAGATVVMLLPARTSVPHFHDYCLRGEIRWVQGRLKFGGGVTVQPRLIALW